MINRKTFIKHSITLGAGFYLTKYVNAAPAKTKQISLFHSNDIHSRIDPFPANDKRFANQGGLLAFSEMYEQEKATTTRSLLLDCGDIFQGTPYFNLFKGKVEYEVMSKMKYDASTLGNHDFDNGIQGLLNVKEYRNFEILNCNYDFDNSALSGHIKPYKIVEKDGLSIGLFGVGIALNGLVPDANFEGIVYQDPIKKANEMAKYLKNKEKCDLVICLSHLGYYYMSDKPSDQMLAQSSSYIDVILGGHTHTFLDTPQQFLNLNKKPIIVNQAGWAALRLGRVDISVK